MIVDNLMQFYILGPTSRNLDGYASATRAWLEVVEGRGLQEAWPINISSHSFMQPQTTNQLLSTVQKFVYLCFN